MRLRAYRPILLFLVVLCCGGISQAQDPETGLYRSFFGEESSSWTGVTEYYDMIENQWMMTTGDTMLDGNVYKKIKSRTLDFLLREEISCGKLWCRYLDEDTEFIVADLSLSLNDTISLLNINYMVYPLQKVSYRVLDTMSTEYGRPIVLESLDGGVYRTIKFIEGIGGTNLFDFIDYPAYNSQILCYHKDGELVYHESFRTWPEENCELILVGFDGMEEKTLINLWPNPCGDWFIIKTDHIQIAELYDIMGHRIIENIAPYKKIDTRDLSRGVYLLRIKLNDSLITKKIVKK